MNSNVDRMISNLTPAIEQKCAELQTARKERLQSRLFVLLCAMAVLIPALISGRFKRWTGFLAGGLYVAYLVVMFVFFGA